MIVVNTPANTTGDVLTLECKRTLCDIARDRGIIILADKVYNKFVYEREHVSFMDSLDCSVLINGFSKMIAVSGWRVGFLCANKKLMVTLIKMQYHICASPSMPAMYSILTAFPYMGPYLDNARRVFKNCRGLISRGINEIAGMHLDAPRGAFYAFPSYDLDMPSAELTDRFVRNGLICTPGSAFGKYGKGHLRFSYVADEAEVDAGMDISWR